MSSKRAPSSSPSRSSPEPKKVALSPKRVNNDPPSGADGTQATHSNSSLNWAELSTADRLHLFQKDAIWREMRVYKQRCEVVEQQVKEHALKQRMYEKSFALISQRWSLLDQDLVHLLNALPVVNEDEEALDVNGEEGAHRHPLLRVLLEKSLASELQSHQLVSEIESRSSFTKRTVARLLQRIQELEQLQSDLMAKVDGSVSDEVIKEEIQRVLCNNDQLRAAYDDLEARFHELEQSSALLRDDLVLAEKRAEALENEVEDLKLETAQAHRRLERERSKIVQEMTGMGSKRPEEEGSAEAAAPVAASVSHAMALTPEITETLREHDKLVENFDLATRQADARAFELQHARDEIVRLRAELEHTLMELHSLPDHRVMELGPYKALRSKTDFYKHDAELARQKLNALTEEVERLQAERRGFLEKLVTEEANKRNLLEVDLRKMEKDVTRIRDARDRLQMQLEAEKAKNRTDEDVLSRLRLNAASNRQLAQSFAEDLRRLKARVAAYSGDEKLLRDLLLEFELERQSVTSSAIKDELPKMQSLMESLQKRAERAEAKIAAAKLTDNEVFEMKQKLDSALAELDQFRITFGDAEDAQEQSLIVRIKAQQEQISHLELKIKYHEQTEMATMNEIESISKAFVELEAGHSHQISCLNDKDEQISRLIADKTKLEQKLTIVHREKDVVSNKVHVLTRQGQKSQEYLGKLESDVKAKEALLESMSKELTQARSLLSVHERKAQEAFQLAEELTAKQDKVAKRYQEFTTILKQKDAAIEQARQAVRRLEEDKLKLDNKIKHQSRRLQSNIYAAIAASDPKSAIDVATISGSPENIREQLETLKDWKKIAQCSVCEFRIKSHVINRCMHVFCKECLDVRIETRQRKCPQCGGSFGPNDIKQIYI